MNGSRTHRDRRLHYLAGMGIDVWERRAQAEARATDSLQVPDTAAAAGKRSPAVDDDVSGLDWNQLRAQVEACRLCGLHQSRTRTVFGVGDQQADLLVIGEAPGAEEDRRGEPFVGRAGKLLDNMLRALGHSRDTVYIANILKSRPPGNRDPKPDEVEACMPYLRRQIALIRPRVILALGRVAAQNLLGTDRPLRDLRAGTHVLEDTEVPVVVSYHPAYLLRSPADKRKAWHDLKTVRAILGPAP